jgi:hypothetical protein
MAPTATTTDPQDDLESERTRPVPPTLSSVATGADPRPPRTATWRETLRDTYFVFDRRTLGMHRWLLGFYLIFDLFRRTGDWLDMFGNRGVLPAHVILGRPQANGFSIVHGFSHDWELWALWVVILVTYVGLLIGWKTKIWQVLALFWVTGMNGRVLLIENGGYVVQNLLLLWTMFLPLGDRFSVDALLASLARRREATVDDLNDRTDLVEPFRLAPHVTIVGLILCFQIGALYYFNVIHKTGPAWANGTATHFVMYNDRMATPFVAAIRTHIPWAVFPLLTKFTMMLESAVPLLLFAPLAQAWARRGVVVCMVMMHLGFGSSFVLGPFAWALCTWSTIFFTRADWEVAARTMRKPEREVTVVYDPRSAATFLFCRVVARLDRFELVWFELDDEVEHRFAVRDGEGRLLHGAPAVAAIVRALPAGAGFAWWFRLPPIAMLVEAVLRLAEGRTSRYFGLTMPAEPARAATVRSRARFRFATTTLRELVAAAFFIGAINQAAVELWSIKRRWKVPQPEVTRVFSHKMRFLQGWFMFSPNPVMDDGIIVVDAVTRTGRHVDPFWNVEPGFDLLHAESMRYNQIWSDYFNRMHLAGNRNYRDAMVEYMRRLPERTGNPDDALVSGEVFWVHDMNPKWRTRRSWNQENISLFTFDEAGKRKDSASGDKL